MLKWICIYRQSPWKFSSWSVQPVWPHSVVNSGVDFVLDVSSAFDLTNREKTTRAEKDRIGALSLIFSLFGSPLCSRTRVRCLLWQKMKLLLLQVNYFRIHCVFWACDFLIYQESNTHHHQTEIWTLLLQTHDMLCIWEVFLFLERWWIILY